MNVWDIVIVAALVLAAALVVTKLIRDKRRGRGSCSCGCCDGCACCGDHKASAPAGEQKQASERSV